MRRKSGFGRSICGTSHPAWSLALKRCAAPGDLECRSILTRASFLVEEGACLFAGQTATAELAPEHREQRCRQMSAEAEKRHDTDLQRARSLKDIGSDRTGADAEVVHEGRGRSRVYPPAYRGWLPYPAGITASRARKATTRCLPCTPARLRHSRRLRPQCGSRGAQGVRDGAAALSAS